ncbi:MAG: hypothetical protein AB8H86_14110 [Polyangiales bacterium]
MIYAAATVATLIVVALVFIQVQKAKKKKEAERVFRIVVPVLQANPQGLTVAEVAEAAGIGRYEPLAGLVMAVQTGAAHTQQTMNGMIVVTRYYPGPRVR